jgi:hypothetical protein
MISVTGALQTKIDPHKAGKLARRLNTEMKRYQVAVDAGADYGILLDAADEIMETVDKLKDVKHDLVKTGNFERDIAICGGVNYENEHHED